MYPKNFNIVSHIDIMILQFFYGHLSRSRDVKTYFGHITETDTKFKIVILLVIVTEQSRDYHQL